MDKDRVMSILFAATFISMVVSIVLSVLIIPMLFTDKEGVVAIISPVLTYCIGRYLYSKEYRK